MKILSIVAIIASMAIYSASAVEISAADRLQQALSAVNTYEAVFHQKIKDAQGAHLSQASGSVRISRPNKFYWKSDSPDPIIVVADGKHLWNYDVDLAQVTQQALAPVMKNSPAGILAGDAAQLTDSFKVSMGGSHQCQKNADQCFVLHPKEQDAGYSHIILGFHEGKLVEINMQDGLGQDVKTTFKNVKINHTIDPKVFMFKPAKGVDVIHADQ